MHSDQVGPSVEVTLTGGQQRIAIPSLLAVKTISGSVAVVAATHFLCASSIFGPLLDGDLVEVSGAAAANNNGRFRVGRGSVPATGLSFAPLEAAGLTTAGAATLTFTVVRLPKYVVLTVNDADNVKVRPWIQKMGAPTAGLSKLTPRQEGHHLSVAGYDEIVCDGAGTLVVTALANG